MKQIFLLSLSFISLIGFSQNDIEWAPHYELQISDFQSKASQIGDVSNYSLQAGISMDFAYQMSAAKFMMAKNFNKNVQATFSPNAASLVAPDSVTAMKLLNFARYQFDLTELYSRKFRKRLYEEKGAFSNADYFQPVYDEIQEEYNERLTMAGKQCSTGQKSEELEKLHQEVMQEIDELSDFCYSCNPPKKKKKK